MQRGATTPDARSAAGAVARLKMNSVLMKTAELTKLLWRAVNESDEAPLTEAEQWLYTEIHVAVMTYEDFVLLGQLPRERRCMICGVPVSRCCC